MVLRKILSTIGLIAAIGLSSCELKPRRLGPKEIYRVEPHHATRIFIIYKDKNGQIYRDTIHQSNKFQCGDIVIDPHNYLRLYGGSMPYGKFDLKEYQKYKSIHSYSH